LRQYFLTKGLVLEERPRQRRFNKGGRQRIDANTVRRELDGHRLGETLHRVLGGAINSTSRRADMTHLRGHIDDGARTLCFAQSLRNSLRDEERRAYVEIG